MKALLVLLLLGGAGYGGYWFLTRADSEAVATYKAYAKAMATRDFEKAKSLAVGEPADKADQIARAFAILKTGWSADSVRYSVESEDTSGDKVEIVGIESGFYSSDVGSGGHAARTRQKVTVEKQGDAWKVTRFEEEQIGGR